MGFVILMLVAAAGFLASAICQALSWTNPEPPGALCLLHFGIFAVWIPLVTFSNRTMPKGAKDNVSHLLVPLPGWVGKVYKLLPIFGALSFAYFIFWFAVYPFLLAKHNAPLLLERPNRDDSVYLLLRAFSPMWMIFYGFATIGFAGLARISRKRKQELPADSPS